MNISVVRRSASRGSRDSFRTMVFGNAVAICLIVSLLILFWLSLLTQVTVLLELEITTLLRAENVNRWLHLTCNYAVKYNKI